MPGLFQNLAGKQFGRLFVVHRAESPCDGQTYWLCRCVCGVERKFRAGHLKSGATTSCGCRQRELASDLMKQIKHIHGFEKHPLYRVWAAMQARCRTTTHASYPDYGGRGVTVCEEWSNPKAFIEWALARGYRRGLTLDRIDNNSSYNPENCRFATWKQQQNNKRNNVLLSLDGVRQTIAQWAESLSISDARIRQRLAQGWSVREALTQPVRGYQKSA